ncbi:ABC transporter permease [Ensifer soli]|uniref:ABC transporter permease n=1 Tax=Ciceribacter sp. sgz301302 TaxID=3342379 RepID=UPI0035B6F9DB
MTATTTATPGPTTMGRTLPLRALAPWIALLCLIVIFSTLNPNFLSLRNGVNVLQQASVLAVLSLGVTFVIVMGSIDLSIGSIVSMAGMLGAVLVRDHGEWAVLAVPFAAAAIGALNGVLFAYARLPSFLTTLGMLFAINGMTLYLTQGSAVSLAPDLMIAQVFNGKIAGIPTITLWAAALIAIAMFVSHRTRFGRYLYAIGGGETVAKLCGVPVARFKLYAFMVSGFLAGFAAILLMLRISGSDPAMGAPLLLPAIAAVVMGGTPLTGGVGGPYRTLLGVLIITVLQNGMNLASVNPFLQDVVLGAGVIAAVAINMDRRGRFIVK